MRPEVTTLTSPVLTKLVLLILCGENYPAKLSKATGNKESPIKKQLNKIEKEGYVYSKKEKDHNKTIYNVNIQKIIFELYFAINSKINERKIIYDNIYKYYNKSDSLFFKNTTIEQQFLKDLNMHSNEISELRKELSSIKSIIKSELLRNVIETYLKNSTPIIFIENKNLTLQELLDNFIIALGSMSKYKTKNTPPLEQSDLSVFEKLVFLTHKLYELPDYLSLKDCLLFSILVNVEEKDLSFIEFNEEVKALLSYKKSTLNLNLKDNNGGK